MATIIGIIIVIFSLVMFIFASIVKIDDDFWGAVVVFFSLTVFAVGVLTIHLGKPSAIDVYRGKTTLQITYKNNVPIDSTVVYK